MRSIRRTAMKRGAGLWLLLVCALFGLAQAEGSGLQPVRLQASSFDGASIEQGSVQRLVSVSSAEELLESGAMLQPARLVQPPGPSVQLLRSPLFARLATQKLTAQLPAFERPSDESAGPVLADRPLIHHLPSRGPPAARA